MQSTLANSDLLAILPANLLTASDIKDEHSRPLCSGAGQQFKLQNPDTLCYLLFFITSQIAVGQHS